MPARPRARQAAEPAGDGNVVQLVPRQRPPRPVTISPHSTRMTKSQAQRRRQDVIVGLGAASLLSFLATIAFSGAMLMVHLAIDVVFLAFLALSLRASARQKARSQVSYLPATPRLNQATVAQRSSAAR